MGLKTQVSLLKHLRRRFAGAACQIDMRIVFHASFANKIVDLWQHVLLEPDPGPNY